MHSALAFASTGAVAVASSGLVHTGRIKHAHWYECKQGGFAEAAHEKALLRFGVRPAAMGVRRCVERLVHPTGG